MNAQQPLRVLSRFLVFRSKASRSHIITAMARDRRHALEIGRQVVPLTRDAYALPEPRTPREVWA
jgi:hypothetical protein